MIIGRAALWLSASLCFVSALGYLLGHDYHRAGFAFFLGCIEATVTL